MFGKATLGLANQNRGGVLARKMDLGDHEYGNDDIEYGNDDLELGNDDAEYGTNMGGLGGEQLASNRLLRASLVSLRSCLSSHCIFALTEHPCLPARQPGE